MARDDTAEPPEVSRPRPTRWWPEPDTLSWVGQAQEPVVEEEGRDNRTK